MLYQFLRLLKYNGTSFTDLSLANQDESATTSMALANTEYIYIGQYYPFNNIFYKMGTANSAASVLGIQYWCGNGTGWVDAVDILDGTSVSGKTLAQSGVIQFSPNRTNSWQMVVDTSEDYGPTEMQGLKLYNLYWARLKVSVTLVAAIMKTIQYAFTSTQQLNNLDVEINGFYDSFATSKTDWIDEIITASQLMLMDIRRMGIAQHYGQLLRFDDVSMACNFKTLWLIYSNLGKAYTDKAKWADEQYNKCLSAERITIDVNKNALVDEVEINNTIKKLVR